MLPNDIIKKINNKASLKIDLGCGPNKLEGFIGIDRISLTNVDIVSDVLEGLRLFPDNSVNEINARSLLEHVDNLEKIMDEVWRVLKKNCKFHVFVPHFSNPYFYSDYTHTKFMGLYTFMYFSEQNIFQRKVPSFYNKNKFRITKLKLIFDSPFRLRRIIKKIFEWLFNLTPSMQELYEENFTYLIPCYAIEIDLIPSK